MMSLPLTRATTLADADESDPQEASRTRLASKAGKMTNFITERSILIRNNGHSNTTSRGGLPQRIGLIGWVTRNFSYLPDALRSTANHARMLYFASIS